MATNRYLNPKYVRLAHELYEFVLLQCKDEFLTFPEMMQVVLGRLEVMGVNIEAAVQHLEDSDRYLSEHGDCPFGMLSSLEQDKVRKRWSEEDKKAPEWLKTLEV